ncbi:Programmed cell death protein 2 [Cryptotermes secundus]|uniref:Programmed cell death protein 2 n=1 Tax=Cryptotermes secundus TaxID=105785 RepID=A0A2J7Q8Z9_9NEOP|nr:programmed cell death protein 2 isoform X2 [Cryptotermes secundus]PNF25052.1 Programmed cell death protein 2 [Cryptotermes secundus]
MAKAEGKAPCIELGYLEECAAWKLESRFFPCKVGGKPAWLDLFDVPSKIPCGKCDKQCIFLCQVYAPYEELDSCFHRTVFIFICRDPSCCKYNENKNLVVYRCQLNRRNKFFMFEPPVEEEKWQPDISPELCKTCCVCGAKSGSHCGKCKVAYYCSKEHQVIDWKLGHKERCSSDDISVELQKVTSPEDRQFSKFTSRIKRNPDQVLRYNRGGVPLWISTHHIPNEEDIPHCEYCGTQRQFEFQILPQMLNYLGLDSTEDSVDWGTLAVYTCSQSCDEGPAYKQEFLWKQDIIS